MTVSDRAQNLSRDNLPVRRAIKTATLPTAAMWARLDYAAAVSIGRFTMISNPVWRPATGLLASSCTNGLQSDNTPGCRRIQLIDQLTIAPSRAPRIETLPPSDSSQMAFYPITVLV